MVVETVKIYSLHEPDTGEIRYVGKTIHALEKRLKLHISNAKRMASKSHSVFWIRSLLKNGHQPEIRLLDEVSTDVWIQAEQEWIAHYREVGARLVNHTDGGEGHHGHSPSEETRRKQRASRVGYRHSEETRRKISESAKRRPPRPGRPRTEDEKRKISESRKGCVISSEALKQIRQKNAETWIIDPERTYERPESWRSKIGDANRGSRNSAAKLNESDVREIKRLLAECELTYKRIGERFGVSGELIGMINRGKRWAHVEAADLSGTHYGPLNDGIDDAELALW